MMQQLRYGCTLARPAPEESTPSYSTRQSHTAMTFSLRVRRTASSSSRGHTDPGPPCRAIRQGGPHPRCDTSPDLMSMTRPTQIH